MGIMVCKVARPAPQDLFNRLRDMFSVNVLGGAPVIPESNEWYVVSNDYAMAEMFYAFADQMAQDLDPSSACCESLVAQAARNGVYPRPASFAEGYIKVTGNIGASLPNRIEVVTSIGNYVSVGTIPLNIDGSGSAVVRVRAIVPGATGNSNGTITAGTIVTPIANVNRDVEICGGNLCGGAEPETCDAFRTRYLDRLAYKPRATQAWIMDTFLQWPCATRVFPRAGACCRCVHGCDDCGCKDCGGRLEFYVMFDGSFPCGVATGNIVQDLNTWMFGENQGYGEGQVEMGVCGRVVPVISVLVDARVDIVGCFNVTQRAQIEANIRDTFASLAPSNTLKAMALRVAISEVIGADIDTNVEYTIVDPAQADNLHITDCCGDIEPDCDYLPCLRNIIFVSDRGNQLGGCQ